MVWWGIAPVKSRSRQQEYGPGFLPLRLLHEIYAHALRGAVLAAEGVRVDLRGGGDGRVAEAFADGRQVHAFLQQEARVAVADRVETCTLGKPSASGKAWRPFPTTPEAYRARLQHSQMTLGEFPAFLFFRGVSLGVVAFGHTRRRHPSGEAHSARGLTRSTNCFSKKRKTLWAAYCTHYSRLHLH